MEFRGERLLKLLLIEATALAVIASFRFINLESAITLTIFTFLFASLIFQLDGSTTKKLALLSIGNAIGLFWNLVFFYFAFVGAAYFGKAFEIFNIILYPFLNLMWIVPFWSLSLGFLPKSRSLPREAQL
jgi:hypothetical protein